MKKAFQIVLLVLVVGITGVVLSACQKTGGQATSTSSPSMTNQQTQPKAPSY